MRIGILVDNPRRDLKGCCLVAAEAAARGHEAFLIPMYSQGYEVPVLKLDVLIVNYLRLTNAELLKEYKKLGILIFVFDTEAGLLSSEGPRSPKGWAEFVTAKGLTKLVDGYFFWGSALSEGFEKYGDIPPHKRMITGAPRYDLTHASCQKLFPKVAKNYILVNTNFAGINPKFGKNPEYEVKTSREAGVEEDLVRNIIRDQKIIMEGVIKNVIGLSEKLPHKNFVLRPHPFESETPYLEAFKNLKNVRVDGSGEIFDALQSAESLVHVNCTTAIDAYFLQVPSISAEFLNTELMANYMRIPSLVSLSAHNMEEMVSLLLNPQLLELQRVKFEKNTALVDSMFGPRDGLASRRILDFIESKTTSKPIQTVNFLVSLKGSQAQFKIKKVLEGLLIHIIGLHRVSSLRALINPVRTEKDVKPDEVSEILKNVQQQVSYKATYARFGFLLNSISIKKNS